MIVGVGANQKAFKTAEFEAGFNVVLADRTKDSRDKDTRNGLGKTTLLSIIHFCLGSTESSGKGLRVKELADFQFHLDLLVRGTGIRVSRSVDDAGSVVIDADTDWPEWLTAAEIDHETKQARLKNEDWKTLLGWALYDLSKQEREKYSPSFRSLINYDIRRDLFDNPFKHFRQQSTWDMQVNNGIMLDLNWKHAQKWQLLKVRKSSVDSIKKALKDGNNVLASMLGTVGELENERDRLERLVATTDEDMKQFRVHPLYEKIENEANDLTKRIHDLSNQVSQLKRLMDFHKESVTEEQPADDNRVIEIYEAAGAALTDLVKRRLDEVRNFHVQITHNRRSYLRNEAIRLETEFHNATRTRESLSNRRAQLMQILETHGALEEYTKLQQLNLEQRTSLEAINTQIEQSREIDRETSEIKIERAQLFLDSLRDLEERKTIKHARAIFNENSESLYKSSGDFIVDIKDSGYAFRVNIPGKGSDSRGISQMKTFCYDLMRAELWSRRDVRPGFLIHDSDIFAGVDERQIARALQLAERKSRDFGFQYIVCLNSDMIPGDEIFQGFKLDDYIRLRLEDDSQEGSLLGIQF